MSVLRLAHDAFHVAMLPFSAAIVAGMFNGYIEAIVERADLFIHLLLAFFAFESFRDWVRLRRPAAAPQ